MDFKLIWTDSAIENLVPSSDTSPSRAAQKLRAGSDLRYMKSPDPEAISRSWINRSREGLASLAKACSSFVEDCIQARSRREGRLCCACVACVSR